MRLKYVFISEYKNLKNFSLDLSDDNFVDIFVGKNGCGKSNLLEALVDVFHHIMSLGDNQPELYFDYTVIYDIDGQEVQLEWKGQKLYINGGKGERKTLGQTPGIDSLLIYYSGHNDTIGQLVDKYDQRFLSSIKTASVENTRELICIGPEYKELLLAVLLMQSDACKAKTYLTSALGIASIGLRKVDYDEAGKPQYSFTEPVLKTSLQRPIYARNNKNFDIENQDAEHRYWKPEGKANDFLEHLHECITQPEGLTVTNGYLSESDTYLLHIDIAALKARLPDYTPLDFFHAFDMLKTLGMLSELAVPLALEGGNEASISHFSDGQFQSVYVYAVTELFKDKECLTLLDEPDSFLHPEWQFDFLSQVESISEEAINTNHILLTSHSASTIASSAQNFTYLTRQDDKVVVRDIAKPELIKSLSSGLITFSEGEAQLGINQVVQSTEGPILWVEGITDEIILQEAWRKLYGDEERPFIIQNAFCKSTLYNLFSRDELRNNYPDRLMFGLFDFDDAYDDWNGLRPANTSDVENDPLKGLTKQLAHPTHLAMLLPVPDIDDIKPQVLNPEGQPWGSGAQSHLPIEVLFYKEELVPQHFERVHSPGGGMLINFKGNKSRFAKNYIPTLPADSFEVFRPMFETIRTKCIELADAA